MKHLIITLLIAFSSTSSFAQTDCNFLTDDIFVCYFDGVSGLEIFENLQDSQIEGKTSVEDGGTLTNVLKPKLHGYDLDIKNCVSEAYNNEAKTTCFLNTSGFSTARPKPIKTVIKRIDVR